MVYRGHRCEVRRLLVGRVTPVCHLPTAMMVSAHFFGCLLLAGSSSTPDVLELVMTMESEILKLEDNIAV